MNRNMLSYHELAHKLIHSTFLTDPWIEGKERFSQEAIILKRDEYARLLHAAERIAQMYDEYTELLLSTPTLLDSFFLLSPFQKYLWSRSGGLWHGIARCDLFFLRDGRIACCEINCDTPSGEPEAFFLNQVVQPYTFGHVYNPNEEFQKRFIGIIREFSTSLHTYSPTRTLSVGIVYPTELTEDLAMIRLYESWLRASGFQVVTGSPFNLSTDSEYRISLLGQRIDILLRHYKTDWWCERASPWLDAIEDFWDSEPLQKEIFMLSEAEARGTLVVVNPFGSVVVQNKLSMAFLWKFRDKLSSTARHTLETYIPKTYKLSDVLPERRLEILTHKDEWVLKSDFGCEGDEVILGRAVSDEIWQQSLEFAQPDRWIIQQWFDIQTRPLAGQDWQPNFGIYLLGGKAQEIYTRISPQATDYHALSCATFIEQ